MEVHILGGTTRDEVLYVEGFYEAAAQLGIAVHLGLVYRIAGGQYVQKSPEYSTSKLPYFLRCMTPVGVKTLIEACTDQPWCDLPLAHPFTNIASLTKVDENSRCCLLGIVSHQPGLVPRSTPHGPSQVNDGMRPMSSLVCNDLTAV